MIHVIKQYAINNMDNNAVLITILFINGINGIDIICLEVHVYTCKDIILIIKTFDQ